MMISKGLLTFAKQFSMIALTSFYTAWTWVFLQVVKDQSVE